MIITSLLIARSISTLVMRANLNLLNIPSLIRISEIRLSLKVLLSGNIQRESHVFVTPILYPFGFTFWPILFCCLFVYNFLLHWLRFFCAYFFCFLSFLLCL